MLSNLIHPFPWAGIAARIAMMALGATFMILGSAQATAVADYRTPATPDFAAIDKYVQSTIEQRPRGRRSDGLSA
jgi:hypothetical protein